MMTLRYLIECFGDDRAIDSISLANAVRFDERLSASELEGARKTKQQYTSTEEGIRCHRRNCESIFNFMLTFDEIQVNPFSLFESASGSSKNGHHVTLGEFRKLFNAAPTRGWGLYLALCRLGGLRREAARTLPWSAHVRYSWGETHRIGIDWERHRLLAVGNCKATDHPLRYREVPICPLLYRLCARPTNRARPGLDTRRLMCSRSVESARTT